MTTTTRKKTGGRKKGTPNKRSSDVESKLEALGCDPIEGMAKIGLGNVPCVACNETGKVTIVRFFKMIGRAVPDWVVKGEDQDEVESNAQKLTHCPLCSGTGVDPVDLTLRGNMFKELAQYIAPKRKATELTGKDGKDLIPDSIKVVYE